MLKGNLKNHYSILWHVLMSVVSCQKNPLGDRQWNNRAQTKETPSQKCVRQKSSIFKYNISPQGNPSSYHQPKKSVTICVKAALKKKNYTEFQFQGKKNYFKKCDRQHETQES